MTTDSRCERHWTVSVYVVSGERVALHYHARLALWLPAGGHIEPGELPDEAALREVAEETGLAVALVDAAFGPPGGHPFPAGPRPLARPLGIQLAPVAPGHEHIDLIYAARPLAPGWPPLAGSFRWLTPAEAAALGAPADVLGWAQLATALP
ncbi:MAG: NUDIX domain-containing protein [Chloroflexi bacterium]|nr:NUDIX domain-containing protein [Chloroflexota bacterium]